MGDFQAHFTSTKLFKNEQHENILANGWRARCGKSLKLHGVREHYIYTVGSSTRTRGTDSSVVILKMERIDTLLNMLREDISLGAF